MEICRPNKLLNVYKKKNNDKKAKQQCKSVNSTVYVNSLLWSVGTYVNVK